jgi:hypothetical protein
MEVPIKTLDTKADEHLWLAVPWAHVTYPFCGEVAIVHYSLGKGQLDVLCMEFSGFCLMASSLV